MEKLFKDHLDVRQKTTETILDTCSLPGLVLSSGVDGYYFQDDQHLPFRSAPHFVHWCPCSGPGHALVIQAGEKPKLLQYVPSDFWYDQKSDHTTFWQNNFEIQTFSKLEELWKALQRYSGFSYIGPEDEKATAHGLSQPSADLIHRLHWARGVKTPYEIHCLKEANRLASLGHIQVREAFSQGATEFEMLITFLQHVGQLEGELPYTPIIGVDEKSAILHYQLKRKVSGKVLLIDAGANCLGYASDITRTYVKKDVHPVFLEIVKRVESFQQQLCEQVVTGTSFLDLHVASHTLVAQTLIEMKILDASVDEAISLQLTRTFFPHGLGHMLGVLVHDVGGQQKNAAGDPCEPNSKFPTLRTIRELRPSEVITIEPGIYFIPLLLDQARKGEHSHKFNWPLIDELIPFGGVRVEDNVLVGQTKSENLTRPYLNVSPVLM